MDIKQEIETALDVAARVAENPLAQSVLGLAFVPPSVTAKVGELLQLLDLELASMHSEDKAADPTPTASPSAAASSPADAPQPAGASGHSEADPKAPVGIITGGTTAAPMLSSPFVPPTVGPPIA